MENTEAVTSPAESGPTEESYVAIEEAADADLDAYLERARSGEFDVEDTDPTDPNSAVVDSPQEQVETSTEVKEPPKEGDEKESDRVTLSRAELEAYQQRIVKLETERRQQEEFIQRRNTELGTARSQLEQYKTQLQAKLEEADSPQETHKILRDIDKVDEKLEEVQGQADLIQHVHTTHQTVSQAVDLQNVKINDVAEILAEDGIAPETVDRFLANPYLHADAGTLVQLFKRAADRAKFKEMSQALAELVPITRRLLDERKDLKKKPEEFMRKVEKAMKAGPSLNGNAGNGTPRRSMNEIDVTTLSDAELDDIYNESRKKRR